MNALKNIKVRINNYLKKIAETNEKTYGKGKLKCCYLNKGSKV